MLRIISSSIDQHKLGSTQREFDVLSKKVDRLEQQLKASMKRADRRSLQLAEWFDEDHRDTRRFVDHIKHNIHHIYNTSRNHRSAINNIK